jgi:uncharacterized protein YeaO (DUF488 family)
VALKLKRIYEAASPDDGERYLVDRLWPRGISKDTARLTGWLRELAPSTDLRRWFGHQPERWPEFQQRYQAELETPDKRAILQMLADKARTGAVTLLYAARDTEHNEAVVLQNLIASDGRPE